MIDIFSMVYVTPIFKLLVGTFLLGSGLSIMVYSLNSHRDSRRMTGLIDWTFLLAQKFCFTLVFWFALWTFIWSYEIWVTYGPEWLLPWPL